MPNNYQLIKHLGNIGVVDRNGHQKMASRVVWYGYDQSLDIRKWEDGEPKKGISLRGDEIRHLCLLLKREYPEYFK